MDFEKEMEKSLRVIRENLQALNNKTPTNLNDLRLNVKRRRRTMTLPLSAQGTSAKFVGQESTRKERCFSFWRSMRHMSIINLTKRLGLWSRQVKRKKRHNNSGIFLRLPLKAMFCSLEQLLRTVVKRFSSWRMAYVQRSELRWEYFGCFKMYKTHYSIILPPPPSHCIVSCISSWLNS